MSYTAEFFDEIRDESLSSAQVVVPLVVNLVGPRSVVDVGCATGAWLSVFRAHGIGRILGLDGTYVDVSRLLIPVEFFRAHDLAHKFTVSEQFDLAVSLEVAEHLPASSASGFVKSLCDLAPVVLFSAAVPGQGGLHHVNEQWPEYWREHFAEQGFLMFDPLRPAVWMDKRVSSFYRTNMFLFVRQDHLVGKPELARLPQVTDASELILIEPHILFGLRATLQRLPHALWAALRRRVGRH